MSLCKNRNTLSNANGCPNCSKISHARFFNTLIPNLQSDWLSDHSRHTNCTMQQTDNAGKHIHNAKRPLVAISMIASTTCRRKRIAKQTLHWWWCHISDQDYILVHSSDAFWTTVFSKYFLTTQSNDSESDSRDDLLFFVRDMNAVQPKYGSSSNLTEQVRLSIRSLYVVQSAR